MALKIAVLCVAAALVCLTIRVNRPEIAMAVAMAAGLVACALSLNEIRAVIDAVRSLTAGTKLEKTELKALLRACGLTLIGESACQLCRDAGEGALAQRVEFASRVSLLATVAPLAAEVMGQIADVLP